jgi:zinc transport system ATP-binding protein
MNEENIIELENVTAGYKDVVVLQDVSLNIHRGSFLAIVGPNGAGKTTLIKVVLGLLRPLSGRVKVFGKEPLELGEERKRIGYVPQIFSVDLNFPISVTDVVSMGRYGKVGLFKRLGGYDIEAVKNSMEKVGILELKNNPISRLSGGQRQRVFLARALAIEPDILFLDEPTTGVDVTATESLYELLHALKDEGITIIVVSHDIGVVASYVDSVACLNKRLIVHGRPSEVMGAEELKEMYGCDAMLLFHRHTPHISVKRH